MMKKKILISAVLFFYFLLHIAKIECFPFYHFGMYSNYTPFSETPYHAYNVLVDGKAYELENMDYRKYTYLMNTIKKYDQSKMLEDVNSSNNIVLKHLAFLGIEDKDGVVSSIYTYEQIEKSMLHWLVEFLNLKKSSSIKIEKSTYQFSETQEKILVDKSMIL